MGRHRPHSLHVLRLVLLQCLVELPQRLSLTLEDRVYIRVLFFFSLLLFFFAFSGLDKLDFRGRAEVLEVVNGSGGVGRGLMLEGGL